VTAISITIASEYIDAAMGKMAQALGGGKKDAANAFRIH